MANDNGAAVPKFGEWNDRDATAPSNYTVIFNQVRQERQEAAGATTFPSPRSRSNTIQRDSDQNEKRCCCFPWRRK